MAMLHVSELPPQRAEEAYGLVRLASGWTATEWERCLDEQDTGGVLCATALSGVLLGIAAYRLDRTQLIGPVLRVRLFVAFELGGRGATRQALSNGLQRLGDRLGCNAVLFGKESRGLVEPARH